MNDKSKVFMVLGIMALFSIAVLGVEQYNQMPVGIQGEVAYPDQFPATLRGAPTYTYSSGEMSGQLKYTGTVTVIKTDAITGKETILANDKHNLIVDNGLDYVRWQIGNGTATASSSVKYMALSSDATGVDATDVNLDSEIVANGFARAAGTYAANGTGKWNYTYEWTATNSQNQIQKIGIHYGNTANDNTLFAELTFTPADYLINDKLQAIWSQEIVSS